MTAVSRSISASHPSALTALKALAAIVGLDEKSITFSTEAVSGGEGFSIEMTVTAKNSFSATDVTYSVSGFMECARAICKAAPESGLWGQMAASTSEDADIESLITAASALIAPAYVASDETGKI